MGYEDTPCRLCDAGSIWHSCLFQSGRIRRYKNSQHGPDRGHLLTEKLQRHSLFMCIVVEAGMRPAAVAWKPLPNDQSSLLEADEFPFLKCSDFWLPEHLVPILAKNATRVPVRSTRRNDDDSKMSNWCDVAYGACCRRG